MSENTNFVLKTILVHAILQAKMLDDPTKLDQLITQTLHQFSRAETSQDQLLTEKEVANQWHFLDERKLRNMRFKGIGPKYYKFGHGKNGRIFYKACDIEQWITEHECLTAYLEETTQTAIRQYL